MPDFVRCPCCGCGVGMAGVLPSRTLRCIGCGHAFVAADGASDPNRREPTSSPPLKLPATWTGFGDERSGARCPACDVAVSWETRVCPHCREEFVDEERFRGADGIYGPRRDGEPHLGNAISRLGKISVAAGILGLFTCGLTAPVGLVIGLITLIMAERQLRRIQAGIVDASGRPLVEAGRENAIVAVVLSSLVGAGCAFAWWAMHW